MYHKVSTNTSENTNSNKRHFFKEPLEKKVFMFELDHRISQFGFCPCRFADIVVSIEVKSS